MAIKRIFLGWDQPLCETVPEYLLVGAGAGLLDLRGTMVVVPTRQSSWRLRAALPVSADALGTNLLGPEIVTPPVLIDPLPSATVATIFQSLLAWSAVLRAVNPGELTAFLGMRESRAAGSAWALQVARRLQNLRKELADGGLAITDVATRDGLEEGERWADMAELERRYTRQLELWHLDDAITRKLDHTQKGLLAPEVRRVIVAAVPDPPKLFMTLLERWASAGGSVEVLVAAPEAEAVAFDGWGRPVPDKWDWEKSARAISVQSENIWLEATPADQARRIRAALQSGPGVKPADPAHRPQVAIGVPDRETVAPLMRELALIDLPAFDPQNQPFTETALYRLIQSLLALRNRPGYAEVATLLRHPDTLEALGEGAGLLRELDTFQADHLPVTLDDFLTAPPPLHKALERIQGWRKKLNEPNLAGSLRNVLQEIYQERRLKSDDPSDSAFQQKVLAFDTGLRELEGSSVTGLDGIDAAEVLLTRLQDATVKAERGAERLDLEGWLELAWNPAPLLFVAGMNEGFVPDGHVGDLFLPDSLRNKLELRDDRLRVARDAYLLTALIEQRRKEGRVVLLVGKTSTAGDPLRPSRLLFRCPDKDLVAQAQMLFKDPSPTHAAEAFTISFKLDPALLPADSISDKRSRELSPTIFRGYLASPLRFYLEKVIGMSSLDDRAREPDAMAFGILVHEVLDEMARDRTLWASGDPSHLADWMETRLRERFRIRYGARPWLGVELALDSAVQRLSAFALKQVAWHADGWETLSAECEVEKVIKLEGMTIKGRIDRIDRNRRTGAICVLDYKTTDKAKIPQDVHFGPAREGDDLGEADIPIELLTEAPPVDRPPKKTGKPPAEKRGKRWADLQLPLYREFVRAQFGPEVQLGYICLPKALGETGFYLWDPYPDALHASAIRCAEAVIKRIQAGAFWPPGTGKSWKNDDLAGVLLGDPEKSICPPLSPWRVEP